MKDIRSIKLIFFILTALSFGGCSQSQATSAPAPQKPADAPALPESAAGNETIRFLEKRLQSDPDDFVANNKLASEYLQRLRETGDMTYLNLAHRAATASLASMPAEQNRGGLSALTQVEFSSHDFAAARDHAKRLIELDPNKAYPFQFLGDSLLELGQYEEAEKAFEQMVALGGTQGMMRVAMEQRLARLALLRGNNERGMLHFSNALKFAASMVVPPKETVAWTQWQLGETAFARGDHKSAEKYYRDSLATYPDYFRSLASLGRVRAALGDMPGAIEQYEKAVQIMPDPAFAASLGDLYKLAGRDADAQKQYDLVEQIGRLSAGKGTLYNRQLALFYADHDLKPDEAYANAAREYEARRDIYGADALAWTALKAGKIPEAQTAIKEALKLGTKDARLHYHAGMIAKAAGDRKEAARFLTSALAINPAFDPLQAANAKAALLEVK